MSRSNPVENNPNPATRWFEWDGANGTVRYYDKDAKKNVDLGTEFAFILLDELGSVRGWHDASDSGIYSNEVKDTRQDAFLVKSFKGGILAQGIYKDIKDRIAAAGGQFTANLYIAFKSENGLALGSLRMKGAALGAWMEFRKAHRSDLYKGAIGITAYTEGKKGKVVFRVPVFTVKPITAESDAQAIALDKTLQAWLKGYLAHSTRDQVEHAQPSHVDAFDEPGADTDEPEYVRGPVPDITDDDLPF